MSNLYGFFMERGKTLLFHPRKKMLATFAAMLCMMVLMPMSAKAQSHDYSQDYLTFTVLSDGTIPWKSVGSGMAKEIFYSINNGEWTAITASSNASISVVTGNVVRFKGSNTTYASSNANYSGFDGGTATYDISGNIMSLVYGDSFIGQTVLTGTYNFCSIFKQSRAVSAEHLILPAPTLTDHCYRAMFSKAHDLVAAPALPATSLATRCYWYMFEECPITTAPELNASTLVKECYGYMFEDCSSLNYIKCLATNKSATDCLKGWVTNVSPTGFFVKDANTSWNTGISGIPTGWVVNDYLAPPEAPVITFDGEFITITCNTYDADIYYRLGQAGSYSLYSASILIHENTMVEAYAEKNDVRSDTVSMNCEVIRSYHFAGMEITPGPLYYGSNGYEIKDSWNNDSYNTVYGKTVGSTYFNYIELGQLFESSVFTALDGDIEKVLDPLEGWRIPTHTEWASILGTTRSGSTVNGSSNKHYAMIQLTGVTHANSSTPSGILIFPDGETITGVALSEMDNTTPNTGITESQLNVYLGQGCIFLPGSGYYNGSLQTWGNEHHYWSSTETGYHSLTGYDLYFLPSNTISPNDSKDKGSFYFPVFLVKDAADKATRLLKTWTYNNNEVELPYSVNAIDGHSGNYARGTFSFTTAIKVKESQPTYLWFQHADQSADIYVNNTMVETHWGGYNAFFTDITNYVSPGINNIRVTLNNTSRNTLAPYAGDFNFNATLGEVKLISSPVVPDPVYGYDGFHIASTVTSSSATITVKTKVPVDAIVTCSIKGTNCDYTYTQTSDGTEMTFEKAITDPHLWNGTLDPYLYDVTLTIAKDGVVYHKFKRGYGLRFFEYVINNVTPANSRFMLNGSPYLLRGVCMHNDLEEKANALTAEDIDNDFAILKELGCNFVRLAHYPHPKEVYDWCDKLGIIVQTEVPWVNNAQSTLPSDYYTHLEGQYRDMVNQHYNHPCIVFWGLSNETTTNDKNFIKGKINGYISLIKSLDPSRMVGYVMSHSVENPSGYYNDPDADWFGCNIYVGWYIDQNSNNPTGRLNTRLNKTLTRLGKPLAFSEYGCGGTQHCHSDNFLSTTTRGNNARHDIEYQMWLHEGHIAAIRNFPQLLFTSQWQLFDIAVSNRQEGFKVSLDGETVFDNNELKRLNNKGLVERDHRTKKDPFYLYKAWWNQTDMFVHICGKDYERLTDRAIKCYTNDGNSLSLYVNNTLIETVNVTDHIATFTARTFAPGDVIRVEGETSNDTFTFTNNRTAVFTTTGNWNIVSNWSGNVVPTVGSNVVIAANATIPANYVAHVGAISINSGKTLTIADGGQLLHSNAGVTATVKKNISAYTVVSGLGLTDGWYFIASPLNEAYTPTADNMLSNTYDLYRLNNTTWENFRNHDDHPDFTTLNNGAGYLYANSNQVTLRFTGELKPYAASASVPVSAGWNLVGNPFVYNVYASQPYYRMNNAKTGIEAVDSYTTTTIAPCTGIIIDAAEAGNVTFSREAPVVNSGNNGRVYIALSQPVPELAPELVEGREGPDRNQVGVSTDSTALALDNAIVSFDEGSVLPKFHFGNNAEIYLPQGNENYAIAFSDKQGEMPLCFKAKEDGTYTISVNPEGMEMAYLHLVDNMTGEDIDLLSTPSYTFTAKTTDYESRFRLVFSTNMEDGPSTGSGTFAFYSNGSWIIANKGQATLQVIDLTGRILSNETINGYVSKAIQAVPGMYMLRLIKDNEVKTQKIVVR